VGRGDGTHKRKVNGTSPWSTHGEDKATRARGVAVTGDNRWRQLRQCERGHQVGQAL
jgi:hypothetical protein